MCIRFQYLIQLYFQSSRPTEFHNPMSNYHVGFEFEHLHLKLFQKRYMMQGMMVVVAKRDRATARCLRRTIHSASAYSLSDLVTLAKPDFFIVLLLKINHR